MSVVLIAGAVAIGIQLLYSSASFITGAYNVTPEDPPHFTPKQVQALPRDTTQWVLPTGRIRDRMPPDPWNHTHTFQPNPATAIINPDAILPAGFAEAYQKRLNDGINTRLSSWGEGPQWLLDPNLRIGRYPALRVANQPAFITPDPCTLNNHHPSQTALPRSQTGLLSQRSVQTRWAGQRPLDLAS